MIELYSTAFVEVQGRGGPKEEQLLWWPGTVTTATQSGRNQIKMNITWEENPRVPGYKRKKSEQGIVFLLRNFNKSAVAGAWRIRQK